MSFVPAEADALLIRSAPMFDGVGGEDVQALLDDAYVTHHPDGCLLFSEGDPADRFFLVLDGIVNLFALTEAGDQSILEVIERGHTFAEAAIFASKNFPINAECRPGTRLLEIPAQSFMARLGARRGLSAKLLAAIARWQRRMLREIAELKGLTPVQRLGLYLLAQLRAPVEGESQVTLPFTKVQLASRIGITPESLSRALARLKPLGVTSRGREFVIADPMALRRFCQD